MLLKKSKGIDAAVARAGSQKELAAALGVTQQSVSLWQKLGYVPLMRAKEIEMIFNVSRKSLVNPRVLMALDVADSELT